jgi:hypothetical protein
MNNNIPTPKIDSKLVEMDMADLEFGHKFRELRDFARQLERELAKHKAPDDMTYPPIVREFIDHHHNPIVKQLRAENEKLLAQIAVKNAVLQEALDELITYGENHRMDNKIKKALTDCAAVQGTP